ncbi:MAG: hypothetical protein D6830_06810 [Ignavibacteria bacterium]|nr:MAG: hypothetical protein D6830_06810 [Ignavibacteria bacterium]
MKHSYFIFFGIFLNLLLLFLLLNLKNHTLILSWNEKYISGHWKIKWQQEVPGGKRQSGINKDETWIKFTPSGNYQMNFAGKKVENGLYVIKSISPNPKTVILDIKIHFFPSQNGKEKETQITLDPVNKWIIFQGITPSATKPELHVSNH